ncbi:MAG TPA: hypothetical protein VK859_12330 [bacterium]|jgi:hypothetical protein|nr:hypothetical protein [bacterium]
MGWNNKFLALFLVVAASNAQAAEVNVKVNYRLAIMEDDRLLHEPRRQPFGFRMEIVNDNEGVKPETLKDGRPFVAASPGERYSVRLTNPLPVRVAVNLTVDGLNSITGRPSGIADGEKWMIEPYGSVTIPGWQVSGGEARRFFFTDKPKSYAKWRGDETGKDLAANCGVIGAAYFWNQEELNQYYDDHPVYRYTQRPPLPYSNFRSKKAECLPSAPACAGSAASESMNMDSKEEAPQQQAGTGMGERESNPTVQVAFDYDAGMYSVDQALVIYYDFAKVPGPNPFPALGFAPETP